MGAYLVKKIFASALLALVACSASAQTPVQQVIMTPHRVPAYTDEAGSVAQGGSWQQAAPANPYRDRLFVQNYCTAQSEGIPTSESMFIATGPTAPSGVPTASASGVELMPCGSYDSDDNIISTDPLWVFANTTGHRFMAFEW
jgi:hypothetical protein